MTANFDITKGKYSLNRVSANPVPQQDVIKAGDKDAEKLQKYFNAFDIDRNGVITTEEQVEFAKLFKSFDTNNDGKLSTKEFDAYEEGNIIRDFFQRMMKSINKSESVPLAEAEAFANEHKPVVPENTQEEQNKPAKKETVSEKPAEVKENQNVQPTSVAQRNEEKSEKPQLHKYIVQMDESFTQIIKKSLKAQGIENPTPEQIKEAKAQFKQDNPKAVKTNKKGYEFLLVGAEVKLRAEVAYAKDSDATIADWCEKYPNLVLYPPKKSKTESSAPAQKRSVETVSVPAKTKEERTKEIEKNFQSVTADLTPKETINEQLQTESKSINKAREIAPKLKESLDSILTHDWFGADSARVSMGDVNKYNVAYITDETIAERIDNVFGLNKNDVKKRILGPMMERAAELGALSDDEKTALEGNLSLEDMQGWINKLSERIKSIDSALLQEAEENRTAVASEEKTLKAIQDNKNLIETSLISLTNVIDMAENEPKKVEKTVHNNQESAVLADGTTIKIKRDDSGKIIAVGITNPNSKNKTDVAFFNGAIAFSGEGESKSAEYKTEVFSFDQIRLLAEKIFGKKDEKTE